MQRSRRAAGVVAAVAIAAVLLSGCTHVAPGDRPEISPGATLSATVADAVTAVGVSDGDLWPSCWSDDDALYAANGDGSGFGSTTSDIVMNRITGSPASNDLEGTGLASGDARKPTGMLCAGGTLYLAVQDLRKDFNAAPSATIARSDNHGKTWHWHTAAPMFEHGVFTTIWFADFGRDAAHAPDDGYAYAYGLDGNWRDSFDDSVPDPTELFLARVPLASVQDASTWEFFAGEPGDAEPTWTTDIAHKRPVLIDERRVHDVSVLSQGGVTFLPNAKRYLYTSWTEYTFEFYESPSPWGPWALLHSDDFGTYPWSEQSYGGYATTIPSKFVAADERTMWVQSNVCPCAPAGMTSYWFGLRTLELTPEE